MTKPKVAFICVHNSCRSQIAEALGRALASDVYILLDVLFEHNHYSELVQKEIQNDLLLTEPEYLTVSLPSANCMKL